MTQPPQQDVYDVNPRRDVARYIPRGVTSVLDVGCGRGGFDESLRRSLGPNARLCAVEAVESQAAYAREHSGYEQVWTGYFPEAVPADERFDLICFNDVLEHLLEPDDVLRATHAYLKPGGQVLAAIPSIQYVTVVLRLLRGRWDYTDMGTLDRTHVRFFTRATMVEMFERCGYDVEVCAGANSVSRHFDFHPLAPVRLAARAAARAVGDARWVHFMILARSREA